jgi:hypothetical protein
VQVRESELTEFDALMRFRDLPTDAERMEMLFMGQREGTRESKLANRRLDELNGKATKSLEMVTTHIAEHEEAQAGIEFIKKWGARGTGMLAATSLIMNIVLGVIIITQGG